MDKLVKISRGDLFTNSWVIAECLHYAHKDVTVHIPKQESRFRRMGNYYVESVKITEGAGRPARVYFLNEAQALFLITLLDNTDLVLDFKMELSMAFVKMRRLLIERQTQEWQQTRLQGKKIRLQETDAIKALIAYAREQGSRNADKLYLVYSKLVKQITEYDRRDQADIELLTEILAFERLIAGIISTEMLSHTHYKEIYRQVKRQLTEIKRLWAVPALDSAG